MTVVVGTGYTGHRLLQKLSREPVRKPAGEDAAVEALGLSRSIPSSSSGSGARIEIFDLDGEGGLPIEFPDGSSLVYTVPPSAASDEDLRLGKLLRELPASLQRFVYISTTGVYGDRGGRVTDESAAVRPESARAKRRVAAEKLLDSWCRDTDTRLLILRAPGIYGPGRLGIDRIRDGEPVLREADTNPGNRIHVDDLVRCCVVALSGDVPPGIYNVGDGDTRSSTWFAEEVARQCGLPAPPTITREQANAAFSARRLSFLAESRIIDTTKMREVLGVLPSYPDAADGIRASLA